MLLRNENPTGVPRWRTDVKRDCESGGNPHCPDAGITDLHPKRKYQHSEEPRAQEPADGPRKGKRLRYFRGCFHTLDCGLNWQYQERWPSRCELAKAHTDCARNHLRKARKIAQDRSCGCESAHWPF